MSSGPANDPVEVQLLGLPVELRQRTLEHHAALLRELAFVEGADEPGATARQLQAIAEELDRRYRQQRLMPAAAVSEAMQSGKALVDLRIAVPRQAADDVARYGELLEQVDAHCRARELLTLVAAPEVRAYWRWWIGEVVAQVREGAPPTPWPGATPDADRAIVHVEGDLDLALASSLRAGLLARIEAGQRDLVIDLSRCTFMDSTGLSLLLTTRARCVEQGGSLRVVNAPESVERLLDMSGVRALLAGG